jgi:hypothetical protein
VAHVLHVPVAEPAVVEALHGVVDVEAVLRPARAVTRQKYIELYRTFVTRCRSASSSWRRGELGVEFPLGAFRPFLWPPSYPALAMAA